MNQQATKMINKKTNGNNMKYTKIVLCHTSCVIALQNIHSNSNMETNKTTNHPKKPPNFQTKVHTQLKNAYSILDYQPQMLNPAKTGQKVLELRAGEYILFKPAPDTT
ncbi:unnamed protein product [Trifolium pratense]|uniref:Uncharacterized protein n=1 Tax=Trifolium pratense TaxID=57577 RepID=A0ACB0L6C2_TRIPR|nr:unnamed protein product [Trifolium pratense]